MIQRIQSVWLLLAAVCAFATFKFEFYAGVGSPNNAPFLTAGVNFLISIVTIAVGALALVNIFLFKQRTLQLRLCVLGILLEALLIFLYYRQVQTYTTGTYSLTAILHGIIVFAFFLAAKGINKDAKLIKDSDRLR